jgi:hypothetical protein
MEVCVLSLLLYLLTHGRRRGNGGGIKEVQSLPFEVGRTARRRKRGGEFGFRKFAGEPNGPVNLGEGEHSVLSSK